MTRVISEPVLKSHIKGYFAADKTGSDTDAVNRIRTSLRGHGIIKHTGSERNHII